MRIITNEQTTVDSPPQPFCGAFGADFFIFGAFGTDFSFFGAFGAE